MNPILRLAGMISSAAGRAVAARRRRETARMLERLPDHVLKDIGWPSARTKRDRLDLL